MENKNIRSIIENDKFLVKIHIVSIKRRYNIYAVEKFYFFIKLKNS